MVDGRQWHHLALQNTINLLAGIISEEEKQTLENKFRNPFGIGNFINHPPSGTMPNCMSLPFNFPSIPTDPNYIDPEMASYIPHIQLQKSWTDFQWNCLMPSVVILTTGHIKDNEELFLNYRFNPKNPYPDWYVQPDEEEAKRRWLKPSFFPKLF